jgi:hypothetical protein
MRWKYLITATPAACTISIAWIMPLLITGHFLNPFEMDGGGRVTDARGLCCVEPTYYFIARIFAYLSIISVPLSTIGVIALRRSERR